MEKIFMVYFDLLIYILEVFCIYEMFIILIFILCFYLMKYFICVLCINNVISLCYEKYRESNFF